MAVTNRDRVSKALEAFKEGAQPFAEQQFRAHLGKDWSAQVQQSVNTPLKRTTGDGIEWDNYGLLRAMDSLWSSVFSKTLDKTHRAWINEILAARNAWAHDETFGSDDTDRILDTIQRFLQVISAGDQANTVSKLKMDLRRAIFSDQARNVTRAATKLDGTPQAGLKAWREIVTPHPDVSTGNYLKAEFAADLAQVYRGDASDEYADAKEFFRRTHLTGGLTDLLRNALRRLAKSEGEPVIELQTNFGGGKTHSMLSLFHLFGQTNPSNLPGVEPILTELGIGKLPIVHKAVLVGTAFGPGQAVHKENGITVHTLWGELAWQLGNSVGQAGKAYSLVAQSDQNGTSPGSDLLVKLFKAYSPSLILIDEWVAYIRQTYSTSGLPGGSFDANLTFAQSLTEAAKASPNCLLVASLPVSNTETGGEGGRRALEALKHTFNRVQSSWRPASQEESYEIIRRRLFEPLVDKQFAERDAVIKSFMSFYKTNDFASECKELAYQQRMESCYPIHPEVFEYLYGKWSSLEKFQQTRGVLRMMASVIYALWIEQDSNLLIMPSTLPLDERSVCDGLTYYLDDGWKAVIDTDVDGANSLPKTLDKENPALARYSACRRVARTIFLASAPGAQGPNPGIDDQRISLACSQPGESTATFGDALRRLADRGTYLYQEGRRYWYSTQPSVTRLAQDRAQQFLHDSDAVNAKIVEYLRQEAGRPNRAEFASVQVYVGKSDEVPDEKELRLVILGPDFGHIKGTADSGARKIAEEILERRGNSPRLYKNMLIFLAAEQAKLSDVREAVAQLLAWASICKDADKLNLAPTQVSQADAKLKDCETTVNLRIKATWMWSLFPSQSPQEITKLTWDEKRSEGQDGLAVRVSKKLSSDEDFLLDYGSDRLKLDLERFNLWQDGQHVTVKQLCEYFASYPYLPRLKDQSLLLSAIQNAFQGKFAPDVFAYAAGFDEAKGTYAGLIIADGTQFTPSLSGLLVKGAVAVEQTALERQKVLETAVASTGTGGQVTAATYQGQSEKTPVVAEGKRVTRRFYASAKLDENRVGRDAGKIAVEVIEQLAEVTKADITVTLEINAEFPNGVDDEIVRVVTENCKSLKLKSYGFEEE